VHKEIQGLSGCKPSSMFVHLTSEARR